MPSVLVHREVGTVENVHTPDPYEIKYLYQW